MKKKVVIRAPLLSKSGYGHHSRDVFKWLLSRKDLEIYSQIVPWGITSWYLNESDLDGLIGQIMKTSMPCPGKPDISFQVQLPNEWDPNFAHKNVGISAYVETDVCSSQWIDASNKMSHIIVPSKHVELTIKRSGHLTVPLSIIPESIAIKESAVSNLPIEIDTSVNFLTVGQLTSNRADTDRKNLFNTIKWFCEVFSQEPEVGLIVKTNSGTSSTVDFEATKQTLKIMLEHVRQGPYPRVYLLHGDMTTEEMTSLYKREDIKAFISCTRGEGFGLPLLEAAAADIPVIATNWSGHLSFLKSGKFIPLKYKLVEIPAAKVDGSIFIQGSHWAEVSESDFKQKILHLRHKWSLPKSWAVELGKSIRQNYSIESIIALYDKSMEEICGR